MPRGGAPGEPSDAGRPIGEPAEQWQSSTPGRSEAPGPSSTPGQGAVPGHGGGAPGQGGVPGQGGGAPGQGGVPGQRGRGAPAQQQWAGNPQGQQYGYPSEAGMNAQPPGPMQGRPISPVNEIETRVTGRRIVQYIIDAIIYSIVAGLISWALDRSTGGVHALLILVSVVLVVAWYLLYWAWRPYKRNGQTIGMQLMGIRVSSNGGPASFVQLAIRSILLVLFSPLSLLVGIIVMMFSRYRQRVGDHIAKTIVVRARVEPMPARREYAGAGQAGFR